MFSNDPWDILYVFITSFSLYVLRSLMHPPKMTLQKRLLHGLLFSVIITLVLSPMILL